jgi:hypothetical protein
MQFFNINRVLLGIIAVIVIAAAIFMIVVPLLDQPAVADVSAAAPIPQQPSLDDAVQDFADRMALDRRLRTLEQQLQTLSNTAPGIGPQQPPIADPPQDFADKHRTGPTSSEAGAADRDLVKYSDRDVGKYPRTRCSDPHQDIPQVLGEARADNYKIPPSSSPRD